MNTEDQLQEVLSGVLRRHRPGLMGVCRGCNQPWWHLTFYPCATATFALTMREALVRTETGTGA